MGLAPVSRIGQRVGDWEIVQQIGRGGMATVYVVRTEDGTAAAMKVLHPAVADDETVRQRFRREAYVANAIEHPGVVQVLGDGETPDGAPYLVMELLDGESLEVRRTRKGGLLPLAEVLWIADETLAIVAAAHAKAIVHRDLKPENLFLTHDARIKVLDFGIARLGGGEGLTRAGTVLGTLGFMAPEQARGEIDGAGTAVDIYSLGATMFTLLSGRLVRADNTLDAITTAGRHRVPSLGQVAPSVPAAVVGLVDAALSFDPEIRWPSAAIMRRALHLAYSELQVRPAGERISTETFDMRRMRPVAIEPPPMSIHRTQVPGRPRTVAPPRPPLTIAPAPGELPRIDLDLDLPRSSEPPVFHDTLVSAPPVDAQSEAPAAPAPTLAPSKTPSGPPPALPAAAEPAHRVPRWQIAVAVIAVVLAIAALAWEMGALQNP